MLLLGIQLEPVFYYCNTTSVVLYWLIAISVIYCDIMVNTDAVDVDAVGEMNKEGYGALASMPCDKFGRRFQGLIMNVRM